MAYTAQQIFDLSIAIKNDLSEVGLVTDDETAEFKYRAPYLLDAWQKEIARVGDLYKEFEVSCFRKKNLLTDVNQFRIIENNAESQAYSGKGANSFYLEVDGDCTITFSEDGGNLSGTYIFNGGTATAFTNTITITVPSGTTSFLPVRGILSPASQTSTITMTLSGSYYFRHNNRALSPYKFSAASKVPDFKPWYKIEMPADFKSKTQVIDEFPSWQYAEATQHKWEGSNELYVLFSYEGTIRIKYIPVPAKITSLTQTLEVDDITAMSGAYYLAEQFATSEEEDSTAALCKRKYAELKAEISKKTPLAPQEIIDIYE